VIGWGVGAMGRQLPSRACQVVAAGVLLASVSLLAGCETDGVGAGLPAYPIATPTVQNPDEIKYFPSDEPLRQGYEAFHRGNYGIAERYFRDAVEKYRNDPAAWMALAAAYDRLARFDLADRAYANAKRAGGVTTELLNNEGYSAMLRGNIAQARTYFQQALRRDPGNATIANNLQLLDASSRLVPRSSTQ
jgi:Flp pilus assembly protein TadD